MKKLSYLITTIDIAVQTIIIWCFFRYSGIDLNIMDFSGFGPGFIVIGIVVLWGQVVKKINQYLTKNDYKLKKLQDKINEYTLVTAVAILLVITIF